MMTSTVKETMGKGTVERGGGGRGGVGRGVSIAKALKLVRDKLICGNLIGKTLVKKI